MCGGLDGCVRCKGRGGSDVSVGTVAVRSTYCTYCTYPGTDSRRRSQTGGHEHGEHEPRGAGARHLRVHCYSQYILRY